MHCGTFICFIGVAIPGPVGFLHRRRQHWTLVRRAPWRAKNQNVPSLWLRRVHKPPGVCSILGGWSLDAPHIQHSKHGGCYNITKLRCGPLPTSITKHKSRSIRDRCPCICTILIAHFSIQIVLNPIWTEPCNPWSTNSGQKRYK